MAFVLQQLVHAVRQEHGAALRRDPEPVVVRVADVAVPVAQHHLERAEVDEALQVEHAGQRRLTVAIDARACLGERAQVAAVVEALALVLLQFRVDVLAEASVV